MFETIKNNSYSNDLLNFSNKYPNINLNNTLDSIKRNLDIKNLKEIKFFTHNEIWNSIKYYLIIYALITISSFIISSISRTLLLHFSTWQGIKIRCLTFNSIISQDISWHEK